ncbi:MAG: hypothetical protein WBO14_18195 [Gammaproteobacteria bacterium]
MMIKQHIHIGVDDAHHGFDRFVEAWHKAETGDIEQAEIHLNFEDFAMLSSVLTPKRLELMKTLRQNGPLSVRALAKKLERNYKRYPPMLVRLSPLISFSVLTKAYWSRLGTSSMLM